MKKRVVWMIVLSACLALCAAVLCACTTKETTPHTHDWVNIYIDDGNMHYQICSGSDCDEVKYGNHSYNAIGYCICGKAKPAGGNPTVHSHSWSKSYIIDGDMHYQTCSGCSEKKYGEHDYGSDDKCVCGKKKASPTPHTHTYGSWNSDGASTHSRVCSCNDKQTANHTWNSGTVTKEATCKDFGVKQYTCTVCNATKTENIDKLTTHSWRAWTSADSQNHSHTCSVCNKSETSAHSIVDDVCAACGYVKETDFVFSLYRTGYSVSGYTGTATKAEVPSKYRGKQVIAVGANAFSYNTTVTEIVLPDTIREIQSYAFEYCTKLKKVTIPTCLSVGVGAFSNCTSLTEVEFPDECLTYDSIIFKGCNALQKITFNGGTVNSLVLSGCSSVKELVFGSSIISVTKSALTDCTSLEKLTIPNLDCIDFKLKEYGRQDVVITINGGTYFPTKTTGATIGNTVMQIPASDTAWKLDASTVTVNNGKTAYNKGQAVEVLTWRNVSNGTFSWKEPASANVQCYYLDTTLIQVTITEQQLALNDERISGAPFEVIVLNRFPVNGITVSGETDVYIDEFNAAMRNATVTRSSGETETVKLDTLLSQSDKQKLTQTGRHTVRLTYGDYATDYTLNLKNHSFDTAVFDSQTFYYDGTVKSLAVTGLPAGATVQYTNNNKSQIGTYTVTAKISKQYYDDATLTATLTIKDNLISLQYNLGLDNVENPNPNSYFGNVGLALQPLTSPSHEFLGWYKDANFSQKVDSIEANGLEINVLYAKWQSIFVLSGNKITGLTAVGKSYSEIAVPSEINGVEIREIQRSAFSGCNNLTSITLPFVGATKDGTSNTFFGYIFGASNYSSNNSYVPASLKTVIIASGSSLWNYAFYGCSGLTSVTIPNSVTSIGGYAFRDCSSLTSITYTGDIKGWCEISGLNYIMYYGTSNKTLIIGGKEITGDLVIPDDVTRISSCAFYNCSSLTSVTIGNGVTSIGDSAFYNCSSLTSVTIGNNVTSIGNYAFYNCSSLTSIVIPNSVTSIGSSAFSGCSGLASIEIPNGVTSIGDSAFSGCSSLETVYWNATACTSAGSSLYRIFKDCSKLTTVIIGDSVTTIPSYAFSGCSSLTSIEIPNSVTSIGQYAFSGCSSLTSLVIPNSVTSIENYAFSGCSGLTGIEIPNSVTNIGGGAFRGCSGLASIEIPNSVTSIGGYTFENCSSLTSIEIPNGVTSIGNSAFSGCSSLTSIEIPNGVTSIGNSTFSGCSGLASIEIPNSVSSIEYRAFSGCSSLTSITIGNNVTSIGEHAFYDCSSLASIEIPNSVTSIGKDIFCGCSSLMSVTLPFVGSSAMATKASSSTLFGYIFGTNGSGISVTQYYSSSSRITYCIPRSLISVTITGGDLLYGAFYGCSGLTSITILNGVTSIGDSAFRGCSNLTSITIPNSVTSIKDNAFYGCSSLTSVYYTDNIASWCGITFYSSTANPLSSAHNLYINDKLVTELVIPDSVTEIKFYAFYGCSSLTSIEIPNSVTSIWRQAFYGCSGLTSIEIPNSVTSIWNQAFSDCNGLTSIKIPNSVTSIGSSAFSGCNSLTSIKIPNSVTSIGSSAFSGCNSLTIYCSVDSKPSEWDNDWNSSDCPVVWDCENSDTDENGFIYVVIDSVRYRLKDKIATVIRQSSNIGGKIVISSTVTYKNEIYIVTSIESSAFRACSSLTSIEIPNSVTSIGSSAFYDCSSLMSVTIGNGVTSIGEWAFWCCSSLTSVTIGDSVTSIGSGAFSGCSSLTSVYYNGTQTEWNSISIGSYNTPLTSATCYYYSEAEPPLNAGGTAYNGNYWHYVDGEIVVWTKQ